tara:strand:+ start:475918 stop:476469 length:552 start_codon:yes stop_codon:yes gene_type:complete
MQSAAHGFVMLALIASLHVMLRSRFPTLNTSTMAVCAVWSFACGLALSHIIHEWGHYLGARISGSKLSIKKRMAPLFFDFDYSANNARQYLYLSIGGLLGNIVLLLALLLWMPLTSLASVSLLAAVLGQLIYVLILELPISLGILAGRDPLTVLSQHFGQGRPLFARAGIGGVLTAAAVFAIY